MDIVLSFAIITSAKILTSSSVCHADEINQNVDKVMRKQLGTRFEFVTTSPEVVQLVQEFTSGVEHLAPGGS